MKLIYTQGHQSTNESCINSKNTVRCLIYRNACHLPAMHCIIIDFLTLMCVKALVHVTILLGSSIMVVFSFKKLMLEKIIICFSLLDNPSSMADLEANLTRTMNNLAQNAKELEVY